jgi:hypothetical protein
MLLFKKFKLTRDPCKIGLLRATFYIQFIVHSEPFNLIPLVEIGFQVRKI